MSEVLIALGASHMSLELIIVGLYLFELFLMASLHLRNAILELLESINICHGCWRRIGAFERGIMSEAKPSATYG